MSKIIYKVQKDYINSFIPVKDDLLKEMEDYAEENKIPILAKESVEFIEQLIKISNPKRVLELGTAIAYTTIRIARDLKGKSEIHTIEKSPENIAKAKYFLSKSGILKKVKLLEGEAANIMPQLKKKYDFIFLDADKEDYKKLFDYSMVLLKRGGVIVIDNLLWHGYTASGRVPQNYKISTRHIRLFNQVFMKQPNLHSAILPIGDGIGLGVKR